MAEIALFSLTAALDARDVFYAAPVLVGGPAALVWWRRSRAARPRQGGEREAPSFSAAQRWAIAAVCLTVFAYFGLSVFARSPIPGSVPNVLYAEDLLFHISLAAEAQQHWPLQAPQVSGTTLHYHYFAHLHIAAIAQVTGIDTSIVVLRLYLVPLAALLLLQVALLGRSVSGLAWAGPVAAAPGGPRGRGGSRHPAGLALPGDQHDPALEQPELRAWAGHVRTADRRAGGPARAPNPRQNRGRGQPP